MLICICAVRLEAERKVINLEAASAAHTAGLSFDLSTAFDRVPRELLGKILRQSYDMPLGVINWDPL